MFDRISRRTRAVAVGLSAIAVIAAAPVASAHGRGADPDEVVVRGSCSADSDWTLRLVEHHRWIGVAFKVDSDAVGEPWRLALRHGRRPFFIDVRRSSDPDGIVGVRRPIRNTRGIDVVHARAVNLETRERCRAVAAI
jgi:hypothetical protein